MERIAPDAVVGVVGAGIMGAGIAQVAALAGHPVRLFDTREGAAVDARQRLQATLDALVETPSTVTMKSGSTSQEWELVQMEKPADDTAKP